MSKKHNKKQNKQRTNDLFKQPKVSTNKSKKTESKRIPFMKKIMGMSKLKQLGSILAILVSLGTFMFTCSRYYNDKPAQVTREFCYLNHSLNVDGYLMFVSLLHSNNRKLVICNDNKLMNKLLGCPFPTINNNSNKTIRNFKVDVEVYVNGNSFFNEKDINKDFEITKIDSLQKYGPEKSTLYSFKYKYDVLHAKSSISSPLNQLYLPDSVTFSDDYHAVIFNFQITYEGIDNPINYTEFLYVNYNDTKTLTDKTIENYLNELYKTTAFTLAYDATMISIRERANFLFLNPTDINVNESEFEQYKSAIIKKYNQETKTEQLISWD